MGRSRAAHSRSSRTLQLKLRRIDDCVTFDPKEEMEELELMEQDIAIDPDEEDIVMEEEAPPSNNNPPRKGRGRTRRPRTAKAGSTIKALCEPSPIDYSLTFEDLGGLSDQIRLIQESVIFRQENAAGLRRAGLKHVIGGILLEGPPGTGKTVCAHTLAAELSRRAGQNYSFFTHNAVESFSKWMGEAERTIQKIFQTAATNKPSIIFFDEFDSLCPKRENMDKSGHSYRTIVGTLLSEFNKIQDNDIIIIATTNLKENIDPAMLRNGRFDFIIHFPLPNELQRKEILQIKMKNYSVEPQVFEFLSKHTDGFSGSSLTFLCEEAKLNAFKRQKDQLRRKSLKTVGKEDFLQVFRTAQVPKAVANIRTDILFDGVVLELEQALRPHVQVYSHEKGLNKENVSESSCYLVWSPDSESVLRNTILPRVLEKLGQPVFKISQQVLEELSSERLTSLTRSFDSVLSRAKSCIQPSILLVESIDMLTLDSKYLYSQLSSLGKSYIFVLCTASCGTKELPSELQPLYNPFGQIDYSFQLQPPAEQVVGKALLQVFQAEIRPVLEQLSGPQFCNHPKMKTALLTSEALLANVSQMQGPRSYQKIHSLRTEIRRCVSVSPPLELSRNISALFK